MILKNLRVPQCNCGGGLTSHRSVFQENFVSGGSVSFIIVLCGMSEGGKMQYRKNTHGKEFERRKVEKM